MTYFRPVYGCGMQYNDNRKHNRRVKAAANMRYWKDRKAGRKPLLRDAYLKDGSEPPEGLNPTRRLGDTK